MAIVFHWVIAVLLIANLVVGLWVLDPLLDSHDPATKQLGFVVIQLHKSVGLTVLVLAIARLAWRLMNPPPPYPDHMTSAEVVLAKLSHWGFYALMLGLPLSGWAMASTSKIQFPILYFGLFQVPMLPLSRALNDLFGQAHAVLGWITLALIVLHVAAALKHHYMDRDDVLVRMSPWLRRRGGNLT
ncbi:cytochrome b [Glacieibacterium sp.]|uniref:cytochrome b n=1 Tax=Glacieibacterium sp. TaxID=2860237 RepID=UPI003AFF8B51